MVNITNKAEILNISEKTQKGTVSGFLKGVFASGAECHLS